MYLALMNVKHQPIKVIVDKEDTIELFNEQLDMLIENTKLIVDAYKHNVQLRIKEAKDE